MSPATSRNGSSRRSRAPSATTSWPRGAALAAPRAARPARQHAQGDREEALASTLAPSRRRRRRRFRRRACASPRRGRARPVGAGRAGFLKGWFEVQDEGSQLAALLSRRQARASRCVDLCAGGGGKTLALAAMMAEQGPDLRHRRDKRRLAPIHERLPRAGARNVQVRTPSAAPRRSTISTAASTSSRRCALHAAPAPGGAIRTPNGALRPGSLSSASQGAGGGARPRRALAKPGGRIAYITCSVLPEENDDAVADLM